MLENREFYTDKFRNYTAANAEESGFAWGIWDRKRDASHNDKYPDVYPKGDGFSEAYLKGYNKGYGSDIDQK